MKLRIAHLYPRLMNIYGDRGNVLCLARRSRERGIDVEVTELGLDDALDPDAHDLIFMGGAQDREQRRVADDLRSVKGGALRTATEEGTVVLAVCGAYQLFGSHYREASGQQIEGLGLFDCWTEHPGPDAERLIGNVVAEIEPGALRQAQDDRRATPEPVQGARPITLVGFENHGGRTYLGPNAQPLAKVHSGAGNNGEDGTEGARYRHAFGTYLHGSLLPKNPAFADMLIALALGAGELPPLDDEVENAAHAAALRLTGRSQ